MSTVKALAEVLAEHVKEHISADDLLADDLLERLQDIIAVESAGERLVTNEAGRAAERVQQAPMTATRAQVLAEAESASTGSKEFSLRCKLHDSEKRCALQLETIRDLRSELNKQRNIGSDWERKAFRNQQVIEGLTKDFDAAVRVHEEVRRERDELKKTAATSGEAAVNVNEEKCWRAGYEVGLRHGGSEREEELNKLFEAQKRRELKLQLESDRRARSVAEAIIERVVQIGITERKAIEDINIEAIVDGSKQS